MKFEDIKERKFYFLHPRITYVLQKESKGIHVFFCFLEKSLDSYSYFLSKQEYERKGRAWNKYFKRVLNNPLKVIDRKYFFDSVFKNRGK